MNALIRWLLQPIWWISRPVRRAIMGRFDARVVRLVSTSIDEGLLSPILAKLEDSEARLDRIERLMVRADRSSSTMLDEVDLVLNGLTREIFRLRAQVEQLRSEDDSVATGLSLHSEVEADDSSAGRSRVG